MLVMATQCVLEWAKSGVFSRFATSVQREAEIKCFQAFRKVVIANGEVGSVFYKPNHMQFKRDQKKPPQEETVAFLQHSWSGNRAQVAAKLHDATMIRFTAQSRWRGFPILVKPEPSHYVRSVTNPSAAWEALATASVQYAEVSNKLSDLQDRLRANQGLNDQELTEKGKSAVRLRDNAMQLSQMINLAHVFMIWKDMPAYLALGLAEKHYFSKHLVHIGLFANPEEHPALNDPEAMKMCYDLSGKCQALCKIIEAGERPTSLHLKPG